MGYTRKDLKTMQGWSLERKVQVTQTRIMEWYIKYGGKVFVSFSGGKDSIVLLDLARRVYLDIPAVFVDTGLEYPEIREFVKTKENVSWLRSRYPFHQVIKKYGYPVISKEVADCVDGARKGQNIRIRRLEGRLLTPDGKKSPIYQFEKETGRHGITGVMAQESRLRTQARLKYGCNGFGRKRPVSQPIAFWTEQDVLSYLKKTGIPYAPIYGNIGEVKKKDGSHVLKTSGAARSGCMYCMFGIHLEPEPNRFQRMQTTHPKQYDYCINQLGCGEVLDVGMEGRTNFILPDNGKLRLYKVDQGRDFVKQRRLNGTGCRGTKEEVMAQVKESLRARGYHPRSCACFRDVDVLKTLQKIMEHNTEYYQTDFRYDREALTAAAKGGKAPKYFFWLTRRGGTHCFKEGQVYMEKVSPHNYWNSNGNPKGILGGTTGAGCGRGYGKGEHP